MRQLGGLLQQIKKDFKIEVYVHALCILSILYYYWISGCISMRICSYFGQYS